MPPPDDSGSWRYGSTFNETITAAINDIVERGFDNPEQIAAWVARIREAAIRSLTPPHVLRESLERAMRSIYTSKIERAGILKYHPGVERFTLARVAPRLHGELDRRIMASASLIRLNREEAIETTLRRFSGWATSVPAGGTDVAMRREVKEQIRKPLASLPFRERRVAIDQGHKFVAGLNNILAQDAGAVALIWHSHWRQKNYNYREDHKERDGLVYLLRDSWAQERGFVKVGDAGYYDQVTAVGEEVNCRCYAQYLYSLARLPGDMLTVKGRENLAKVKMAA